MKPPAADRHGRRRVVITVGTLVIIAVAWWWVTQLSHSHMSAPWTSIRLSPGGAPLPILMPLSSYATGFSTPQLEAEAAVVVRPQEGVYAGSGLPGGLPGYRSPRPALPRARVGPVNSTSVRFDDITALADLLRPATDPSGRLQLLVGDCRVPPPGAQWMACPDLRRLLAPLTRRMPSAMADRHRWVIVVAGAAKGYGATAILDLIARPVASVGESRSQSIRERKPSAAPRAASLTSPSATAMLFAALQRRMMTAEDKHASGPWDVAAPNIALLGPCCEARRSSDGIGALPPVFPSNVEMDIILFEASKRNADSCRYFSRDSISLPPRNSSAPKFTCGTRPSWVPMSSPVARRTSLPTSACCTLTCPLVSNAAAPTNRRLNHSSRTPKRAVATRLTTW